MSLGTSPKYTGGYRLYWVFVRLIPVNAGGILGILVIYWVFRRLMLVDTGDTGYFAASLWPILAILGISQPHIVGYWQYLGEMG